VVTGRNSKTAGLNRVKHPSSSLWSTRVYWAHPRYLANRNRATSILILIWLLLSINVKLELILQSLNGSGSRQNTTLIIMNTHYYGDITICLCCYFHQVVSEMTYTVSSGTLISSIPYHTILPSRDCPRLECPDEHKGVCFVSSTYCS